MQRTTIVVLKVLIAGLLGLLLICQIFVVPAVAAQSAVRYSEIAYFEVPGTIVGILFLLCVQVVLVCVWRLLSLVREDSIFSDSAFPDVDVSLAAVAFATLLVLIALVALSFTGFMTPSITLLLRKASQLEADLSEVV